MMDEQQTVDARLGGAQRPPESGGAAPGRGGRMARRHKSAAVLRLLRGEDLETVSRSLGVTAATLSSWRDAFLDTGEAAPSAKPSSRCHCWSVRSPRLTPFEMATQNRNVRSLQTRLDRGAVSA